jgi:Phospholipase_D-nuclease N-terminal
MASRRWGELSARQRALVVLGGCVQVALAACAWRDLARRPPELVRGSKRLWAPVIGVNFVGPISYFCFGRRPDPTM